MFFFFFEETALTHCTQADLGSTTKKKLLIDVEKVIREKMLTKILLC